MSRAPGDACGDWDVFYMSQRVLYSPILGTDYPRFPGRTTVNSDGSSSSSGGIMSSYFRSSSSVPLATSNPTASVPCRDGLWAVVFVLHVCAVFGLAAYSTHHHISVPSFWVLGRIIARVNVCASA